MRLLFGSDPAALVVRCLTELHRLTVGFPDQRAFLVVPEQITVQMERAYLDTTGTSGLMMAEVLSFRRLAHRLLDETGLLPARRVDAFGRRMLLFRVLKENRERMHSFGHLADRSGFLTEVDATVGDLRRYGVSPDNLRAAAEAGADKPLADKCLDLATLLAGYNQALDDHDIADTDDDLERLAQLLERVAEVREASGSGLPFPYNRLYPLSKSHVYVSGLGFTRDFTPQEYRILAGFARLGVSLTVAVQADAWPTTEAAIESGSEVFLIGRRTLYNLGERLGDPEPVRVAPQRAQLQDAVARVTAGTGTQQPLPGAIPLSLPASNVAARAAGPDIDRPVTVIELPTGADEIEFIAGEIRRLTQTCGYRFMDMAIALCNPLVQMPLLRTAARRYELSLFLDEARSLAGTSLLRYMIGLLDLPLRNWGRDPVMTVLRSGLTPLDPQAVDLLENDLLERGLFRRDRLFGTLKNGVPAADDAAAQRIRDAVVTVFEPMRRLTDSLRQAETTADCCRLIRGFFTEQGLTARVSAQADQLRAQGEGDAAQLLASAHSVLGQVLEELETIAGGLPISLTDLRDTLRSGLANASVMLIPSALDQIVVGDWRRIARQPCRVLFVIGACLDDFPPKAAPEGLLKDMDRQYLSETLAIHLPSKVRDQAFADAANLHQLLTRPTERLYLGASGSEPADVVQRIKRANAQCRVVASDDISDFWNPRLNARPAAWHRLLLLNGMARSLPSAHAAGWRTLARSLSACRESGACDALDRSILPEGLALGLGALFALPGIPLAANMANGGSAPEFIDNRTGARPADNPAAPSAPAAGTQMTLDALAAQAGTAAGAPGEAEPPTLEPETVAGLFSNEPSMSVSQLEKYAACPFSHLVAYVLNLKERAIYEPESTDIGTLLHGVIELALSDLSERIAQAGQDQEAIGRALAEFRRQDLRQLTSRLMDSVIERERMGVMNDTGIRADVGRRLRQISAASLEAILGQLQPDGYLPQQLEWTFGPGETDQFAVELPDQRTLSLRGKVDRVDVRQKDGQTEFRVIDYKSGDKTVDPDQLYHGLALQLPTYLAAYAASHPEMFARDAGYFHFDRPMIRSERAVDDDTVISRQTDKAFELRTAGLAPDDLKRLLRHTEKRLAELSQRLLSGRFAVAPRRLRGVPPACAYCSFSAVCGFNRRDFKNLPPITRMAGEGGARPNRKKALCRLLAEEAGVTPLEALAAQGESMAGDSGAAPAND